MYRRRVVEIAPLSLRCLRLEVAADQRDLRGVSRVVGDDLLQPAICERVEAMRGALQGKGHHLRAARSNLRLLQARSQHAEPQHERPHIAGLLLSLFFVRESRGHAAVEAQQRAPGAETAAQPSFGQILLLTSWKVRARFAVSQAGMINNLNDGMAWGLFPLYFALAGLSLGEVSLLAAIYPAVWGLVQLGIGALSDHLGRTWLISAGMLVQAGARAARLWAAA